MITVHIDIIQCILLREFQETSIWIHSTVCNCRRFESLERSTAITQLLIDSSIYIICLLMRSRVLHGFLQRCDSCWLICLEGLILDLRCRLPLRLYNCAHFFIFRIIFY
jgi:hypothetical protein